LCEIGNLAYRDKSRKISRTVISWCHSGDIDRYWYTRYVCTCVSASSGMGGGIRKINAISWGAYYYSLVLNAQPCKYNMYKSSLRHIHDPVLSSLKMKGIRLLFSNFRLYSPLFTFLKFYTSLFSCFPVFFRFLFSYMFPRLHPLYPQWRVFANRFISIYYWLTKISASILFHFDSLAPCSNLLLISFLLCSTRLCFVLCLGPALACLPRNSTKLGLFSHPIVSVLYLFINYMTYYLFSSSFSHFAH
jgi:hypothetical protein